MKGQNSLLIEQFNEEFKQGEIYSSTIIRDFLNNSQNAKYNNPAAYTYNRWNRGMADIFPVFKWLHRGEYRYLGWNHDYTGYIYHYPQGDTPYVIGEYLNGNYNFNNSEIVTFTEWRESNDEGVRVVGLNLRVTFTSIDGSISQRKILTNDPDLKGQVIDRFDYIDFESKLGKLLIDKKVDDTFKFGNTEYRIININ
jgi:hypothetical protein